MKIVSTTVLFMCLALPGWAGQPVNINTADASSIASSLDGIGEKRAQAIVEYRAKNGPFKSLEDVSKVKGVGESTSNKNAKNILFK
jgi:competence protein ComEA